MLLLVLYLPPKLDDFFKNYSNEESLKTRAKKYEWLGSNIPNGNSGMAVGGLP
jgi:hypothetical protein